MSRPPDGRWPLAVLLLVLLAGCGSEEPAPSVEVAPPPAELFAPPPLDHVVGLAEPSQFRVARFEVPGTVIEVLVKPGQWVKKGEVLARLDVRERKEKRAEARTLYRAARRNAPAASQGNGTDGPPPAYLLAEAKARAARAKEAASHASADKRSVQRAAARDGEDGAMYRVVRLAKIRNRKSGSGSMRRANRDRLSQAVYSDLGDRVRQLDASITASQLVAKAPGVVLRVNVRPGKQWNTRDPEAAVELYDPREMVVRSPVPDEAAKTLRVGQRVWAELGDGETVEARVHAIGEDAVELEEGGRRRLWRNVVFSLPRKGIAKVNIGDEIRVIWGK